MWKGIEPVSEFLRKLFREFPHKEHRILVHCPFVRSREHRIDPTATQRLHGCLPAGLTEFSVVLQVIQARGFILSTINRVRDGMLSN